jgi:asparagine synthetase B (glutamine-hydrolysing)
MDQNEGRLPCSASPVVISGHPSESLSGEEVEEFFAKKKAQKLAQKVMAGDEWVLVSDETFAGFGYFFLFPPIFTQRRREAQSRGESKIRAAAEWRFWSYLTEQDPWGDKYKELDPLDIMRECGMSKATYYRAKAKFQELGLFDFQESKACVRNLEGISKMRREAQYPSLLSKMRQLLLKMTPQNRSEKKIAKNRKGIAASLAQ